MLKLSQFLMWVLVAFSTLCLNRTLAAELLVNNSFEDPVAPLDGNNFYTTIPGWTLLPSPVVAQPANLVVPTPAYANNPQSTPVNGGRQYFDMNSTGGVLTQTVTLPSSGMMSISTWFSVRDMQQNLSGMEVRLRDSSNTVVASGTTSFVSTDPIGLWKQVLVTGIPVSAGNYTFEIVLDNFNNIDIASLDFVPDTPQLNIIKTSDKTGPVVVGETITYTYLVENTGNVSINNVSIADIHNGNGTLAGPGGEVLFADQTPLGDSSNTIPDNNNWDTLQPGDAIQFFSTYVVTQDDIDTLQ